ncbi:flagellar biosynthesis protein R [Fulvimarina pelagi HTCC2506]|uniref:Flagellar biosynthesis protein R n=1 Tax=Fulvimarina pelagi HTCC2506 TaxID=314231 RepID=Q0G4G5_9HYPH|nr:hypothetical protein [Fulvimarina pelagi]EAU41516.1 flagellar biosynthesis protein R [Fulvimarina pelagi HTCC2506]
MSDARRKQRRLERVLKVQAQKRQIEEWSVSHLRQKRAEIDQADRAILESLDPTSDLHGLFIDAKVRSLRRNDVTRRENEADLREGEGRLSEARRREKGVERRYKQAGQEAASEEGAEALEGHIESFLARLSHSLG